MIDDNISATKQESCAVTDTTNENNNSDSKTESTNRVASPVSSEISELSDGKQVKQINQRDSSVDEFNSCSNTNKRFKAVNETPQEQTQNQKYESMQPRLKKFLKIYQLSAKNSLSGPSQAEIEMSLQSTSQSLSNSQTTPNESSQTQVEQQQPQEHQQQQTSLSIIANVAVALAADEQANESAKIKRSKSQTKQKTNSNLSYLKCIQADQDTTHLMETLLHGERISCFIVGGEKRLCLHDILNLILKDFSVQQINQACQKLSIACLESTPKQLDILKRNHLLPPGAPNCGLLTQTNAERLCAYLMDSSLSESIAVETPPSSTSSSPTSHAPSTLKVVHECFGKTYGHLHINMYSRSDSACVECDTCRKLYTPKNFVCHTHKYETHTRHWGFDSSNWRIYLKLANTPSLTTEESTKSVLTDLKISNKDNIAANQNIINNNNSNNSNQVTSQNQNTNSENKEKEKLLSIQEEEFELFKQKFLTNDLKQNSLPSNVTINSSNGNLSALNQSSFVSQRNHRTSLTDLNNQLIQSKNKAEHKLLNGLLSKPLNSNDTVNSMSIPIVQQCLNQPNVVIQNNSQSLDQIIKSKLNTNGSNKKSTDNNGKYYLNGGDEYSLSAEATKAQVNNNSSPQLLSSYYNYFNSKLMTTNKSFTQQVQATSNIELNMLDLILNEIDLSIESKESAERLRQMVTQMHIYFSEKLNDQFYIKNKMLAEFEEVRNIDFFLNDSSNVGFISFSLG